MVSYNDLVARLWLDQIPVATIEKGAGIEPQGTLSVRKREYLKSPVSYIIRDWARIAMLALTCRKAPKVKLDPRCGAAFSGERWPPRRQ